MSTTLTYRGREITTNDIRSIRKLIDQHPSASRRKLSALLCQEWDWFQPNGVACDMLARGLMLALHRSGHIQLPEKRQSPANPLAKRSKPRLDVLDGLDTTDINAKLSCLQPLEFRLIRRTPEEPIFNALIERYHYLGYTQPVGAHLKYIVVGGGRPLACVSFASPARHLRVRDDFIGWSPEVRRRNLHLMAYNPRYLIFPWVKVRHLASHILGRVARRVSSDWENVYGHPLYYLETFTDPQRFRGTCYRASNWVVLGLTKGRGNNAPTNKRTLPIKEILGYPLTKRFREQLGVGS